jgi:3-deoxy-D-manno-octulosonic-acid transferase
VALETELARRPDVAVGDALWVHAASAGELLQARALLSALRAELPSTPLVLTYTSPSATPSLERFRTADLVFPLPLDSPENARVWMDLVRPTALALVDAELWPAFVDEAARREAAVALVGARLGESWRARFPARGLYRELYRRLALIGCADEESARRFAAAGAPATSLRVTGDLRVDETLRRSAAVEPPELPLPGMLPVLVAGSTWPDDEAVLLPALERLRDHGTFFALVLAPHEVDEKRLAAVESSLGARGFTPVRWSGVGSSAGDSEIPPEADALLVDRVGVLHRLYATARAAYVGGAFHGALHNVMEPAAFAVPVVTGPRIRKSWVARELERACALFPVADVAACAAVLEHLLSEPGRLGVRGRSGHGGGNSFAAPSSAGRRAREVLLAHAGATQRTLEALREVGWMPQAGAGSTISPMNRSGGTLSS